MGKHRREKKMDKDHYRVFVEGRQVKYFYKFADVISIFVGHTLVACRGRHGTSPCPTFKINIPSEYLPLAFSPSNGHNLIVIQSQCLGKGLGK